MSKIQCLNCGADLPAIDGRPCPQCGTIADKARITAEFQTLRKVTAKAEYAAQTKRSLRNLLDFYKENPKYLIFLIVGTIIIAILMALLSIWLDAYLVKILNIILPNVIGCILSIVMAWIWRPKFVVGSEWYEWKKSAKS